MDQNRTPLFEAIMEYNERKPAYFRIPGHRFERGINQRWRDVVGDEIFKFDLTETPYTDDLHNAEGSIKEAQELAENIYCVQFASYPDFLVRMQAAKFIPHTDLQRFPSVQIK